MDKITQILENVVINEYSNLVKRIIEKFIFKCCIAKETCTSKSAACGLSEVSIIASKITTASK
jgi:hypothetical protein